MNETKEKRVKIVNYMKDMYGDVVTRQQLLSGAEFLGLKGGSVRFLRQPENRVGVGKYKMPELNESGEIVSEPKSVAVEKPLSKVEESSATVAPSAPKKIEKLECAIQNYIPEREPHYVKFGHYNDLKSIVKSGQFMNVFVTGLSGNGKTLMIHEICSELKRELFRVNITIETDEDDLLGGFRLVNGETVWHDGPVIQAMKRGAVLLLDEIDLASHKIMCLQPVLEGKGVMLKKINEYVKPSSGFTVVATANTKGKGSEDGRFIGTNILNEAFLERFPITLEQSYPSASVEKKILDSILESVEKPDTKFTELLVTWADVIRKSFIEGVVDELIATRRLVNIINTYIIFGKKEKAIELCVSRFDDDTKESFLDLYKKVDGGEIEGESESLEEVMEKSSIDFDEEV